MKTKYILLVIFLLVAGAQLYVPTSMIMDQEKVLASGKTFRFRTAPVDPNDPMRGKYVNLRFRDNLYIRPDSIYYSRNQKVFVEVEEDASGYARIKSVLNDPPLSGSDFVKATLRNHSYYNDSTRLSIEFPFNRFYMEEYKAPKAEKVYIESTWNSDVPTWAVVMIKDGDAVLEDVMIDGISIVDVVNNLPEQ